MAKLFKKVRIWNKVSEFRMMVAYGLYFFGMGLGIGEEKWGVQVYLAFGIILFSALLGYFKTYKVRYKEVK